MHPSGPRPQNMQASGSQDRAIAQADEDLLASLGYKQEFRREFSSLEVSICRPSSRRPLKSFRADLWYRLQYHRSPAVYCVSAVTSPLGTGAKTHCSYVLFYSMPNGGPAAMVWGVSDPLVLVPRPRLTQTCSGQSQVYSFCSWACRWPNSPRPPQPPVV